MGAGRRGTGTVTWGCGPDRDLPVSEPDSESPRTRWSANSDTVRPGGRASSTRRRDSAMRAPPAASESLSAQARPPPRRSPTASRVPARRRGPASKLPPPEPGPLSPGRPAPASHRLARIHGHHGLPVPAHCPASPCGPSHWHGRRARAAFTRVRAAGDTAGCGRDWPGGGDRHGPCGMGRSDLPVSDGLALHSGLRRDQCPDQ